MNHTGKVIESQPDWLTVSAHGEAKARALLDLGVGLVAEERAHGGKRRKWQAMGYEGLTCGRVTYGQRDTAATELRLSGNAAAEYLDAAYALADRVTRLDLAVTWQADEAVPELGAQELVRALQFHRMKPKSALPWSVSDGDGGFTLYLGKRASEYHYRCYNKEEQERKKLGKDYDGHYDRCWRAELEMKASVPMAVLKKMAKAPDRAAFVQAYVHTYATSHGLLPPFEDAGGQKLVPGFRRASDADSKLRHLAKNVAPTIRFLRTAGRLDDACKALGLEDSNQALPTLGPRRTA